MPGYEVEWSQHQKPWVLPTPEKTAAFVEGLLSQALDVGEQITIKIIRQSGSGDESQPLDTPPTTG